MKAFLFYLTAAVVVLCDQITKWAVVRSLPVEGSREVLGSYFRLWHTHNTGGAFSLLQAKPIVFVVVAAVAVCALVYTYHRYQKHDLLVSAALSLALGGAVGNLLDRIRYGYVVDFFDLRVWPVFNVADSAITVSIVLLMWHFLFHRPAEAPKQVTS